MKKLLTFLLLIIIASCEGLKIEGDYGFKYRDSRQIWIDMKEANGNSYTYVTSFHSWTGFSRRTTLKIENGNIVERKYEQYQVDRSTGEQVVTDSYIENRMDLGSHENGAELRTIDELYDECRTCLQANSSRNELIFETDSRGILSICGNYPENCQDDCFKGVRLDTLIWN